MTSDLGRGAGQVVVRRSTIRYGWRAGPSDQHALILVHGAAAHSGWWQAVEPLITGRRIVVLDLSGHGESGHRDSYDADVWAEEVAAVIGHTATGPAIVVGHSMGGLVAISTAVRSPELVSAVILLDTRLPLQSPLGLPPRASKARLYMNAEEALDRFRLLPPESSAEPALIREVARRGLIAVGDEWRWRYDPAARHRFTNDSVLADLAGLTCLMGYVYGGRSELGGPSVHAYLEEAVGAPVPSIAVAEAFHHLPLDRPSECAAAISAMARRLTRTRTEGNRGDRAQ